MKRRDFLKLLGITSTTAVTSSCIDGYHWMGSKSEKLIPYLVPPDEDHIRGEFVYYPSTCNECPSQCGTTAKVTVEPPHGKPIKLEGNSEDPGSRGNLCMRGQASLTRLYHENRIKSPRLKVDGKWKKISWKEAFQKVVSELTAKAKEGEKERTHYYLSGKTTGSLDTLINAFCERMGVDRRPEFEFYSHSALREGYKTVLGQDDIPHYNLEEADFVLTLGVDLLTSFPSSTDYAGQFSRARNKENWKWYHLEPALSLTGLKANKRMVYQPESEVYLLSYLLRENQKEAQNKLSSEILKELPEVSAEDVVKKTGLTEEHLQGIAKALKEAKRPLVIAGGVALRHKKGLETSVLTALMQWTTGSTRAMNNRDPLVNFTRSENYQRVGSMKDIGDLSKKLGEKEVGVLFVSRSNPLPYVPKSFGLSENLNEAAFVVGMGTNMDETLEECDLILPLSHNLESWGDAEPNRGVKTVIQPVLPTRHDTKSEGDVLLGIMAGAKKAKGLPKMYENYVIAQWHKSKIIGKLPKKKEDLLKEAFLKKGVFEYDPDEVLVTLKEDGAKKFLTDNKENFAAPGPKGKSFVVTPSVRTYDGRSDDLPLLSEIPDPLASISYGEWVSISRETAKELTVTDRDEVEITVGKDSIKLPVRIQPALPDSVLLFTFPKKAGEELNYEVDSRSGEAIALIGGIKIKKTGSKAMLPILRGGDDPYHKDVLPASYQSENGHGKNGHGKNGHGKNGHGKNGHGKEGPLGRGNNMYPAHKHEDYQWTMAIDLEACNGCSACVAACYIENNVALSGPQEHLKGREMSWIRLEPYQIEENGEESLQFVTMLCQQCENAPCEPVCPVLAAVHNSDGLNSQIYNRCVGTRYCANNCPYKVRRFNWFDWMGWPKDHAYFDRTVYGGLPLGEVSNPEVSVRPRGVMEKCTFCVQRIRHGKDQAKDEDRLVRDGEVLPACAQTCPTNAITFGNILDDDHTVSKVVEKEHGHRILDHELNTKPSVYYLGKKG